MLTKNQTIDTECTALGADFEGICRYDGQVIFVPGALPGEHVRMKVIKATKKYAVGRLLERQNDAPVRTTPPCPYFPRCGGCTAQHITYEETLAHKRQQVIDCLERIGGVRAPDVAQVLGMEDPWHYRNKGAFPVGGPLVAPVIGMYAARSHDIIDTPVGCMLQTAQSDALVAAVRRWMEACHIAPYDEAAHTGLVRHVMTREAADGSAMLVLVINGMTIPHAQALVDEARAVVPALRSVILSENTRRTNVILGDVFHTLWGEDTLQDEMAGFAMRVSPKSFFQVNRAQAQRLVDTALDFAQLTGGEMVWDLYCGAGSITLPLAKKAATVVGVEVVEAAIADAWHNARANGVENVSFVAGAVEQVLPAMASESGAPDVIVLDPPRKGADPAALDTILRVAPRRIVYVSCNPATLARDVGILAQGGYALGRVQPVDMFGWTGHIEAVCELSRATQ